MKSKIVAISMIFFLIWSVCCAQSGSGKPPTIEERIKMIDEKICQPLKLNNTQKIQVLTAFRDFFVECDKSAKPPAKP